MTEDHDPMLPSPSELPEHLQPRACPECGSQRLYKDGIRQTASGGIQRYLCRDCGYRFSHSGSTQRSEWNLNSPAAIASKRQVCDLLTEESKNLATVEPEKSAQREGTTPDQATTKGLTVQFAAWLEKEGYDQDCCYLNFIALLAKRGVDITNPDSVKAVISKQRWSNSSKMLATYSYNAFARMLKISWEPPRYTQDEIIPFVPDESELDALIAACKSKRMAAFLQCLKETYADPSEALRIEWTDISGNVITINHPVKKHLPRQLQVSQKLLAMLGNLPKTSQLIFPTKYVTMRECFKRLRARTAQTLQNPRLLKISFTTFRHWGGTMIAHYTNGNVLTVKKLLGHKQIRNTMKYISMINFREDDEFVTATATTVEEIKKLAESGYQKFDEYNGIHIFRKPKRFKVLV